MGVPFRSSAQVASTILFGSVSSINRTNGSICFGYMTGENILRSTVAPEEAAAR